MQMKLTSCRLEGQWLWTQFPCTQNVSYYPHEPFIWNSKKKKKKIFTENRSQFLSQIHLLLYSTFKISIKHYLINEF